MARTLGGILLTEDKRDYRLKVFYAVVLMYWFAMYTYVPILGPYVEHLGGSLQLVGLVVGSYGFSQMLLRIPLGVVSDRLKKRKVFISLGVALSFLSAIAMGIGENPWLILVFRTAAGAAAATWVAFTVLFSSYFPADQAGKAMGVITFFANTGQMVATTLGGFAADRYGWKAPFFLGGAVGLIGFLLSSKLVERSTVTAEPVQAKQLITVAKDRILLGASFLAILLQSIAFSTVYGFTPNYAVSIGATPSQLSILSFMSTLPASLSALKSGDWAERLGERRILAWSFLACSLFTLVIPLSKTVQSLYITQAIAGFARGIIFPVLMGLSIRFVEIDKRATAMGFFQSIYSLGMFGGPVLVGVIGEAVGLGGGFVAVGILGMAAAVLSYVLLKSERLEGKRASEQVF